MPYTYDYPRPAVSVDCVVFGLDEGDLKVLLIQRARKPFAGRWALPGGFVGMNETLDAAARRELKEETGLSCDYLEQLYTFGDPGRDPRGRVVQAVYYPPRRRQGGGICGVAGVSPGEQLELLEQARPERRRSGDRDSAHCREVEEMT